MASTLNVRDSWSSGSTKVGTLSFGAKVSVTGKCSNGWVRIQYDGHVAYVSGKYLTEQQPASGSTPVTPSTGGNGAAAEIAEFVMSFVGYSYVYGGSKPSTGFDCSGLMYYCLTQYGYSMNRVANDQMSQGTAVSRDQLIVGDLVFFGSGGEITHVGIYIGGGKYIAADGSAYGVRIGAVAGSGFTHWFRLNDIAYERKEDEMVTKETIFYNDKAYTVSLIRKDGVTYLKTRDIAEILGLAVGSRGKAPVLADKPTGVDTVAP